MNSHVILLIALVGLAAIILLSCTDDDCPVCPTTEDPVSDYDVYLGSQSSQWVYVFNTAQRDIIDSIDLGPMDALYDIAVSGDGGGLIYCRESNLEYQTLVLDLVTHGNETISHGRHKIEISNSGAYIALHGSSELIILNGATLEFLIEDTVITDWCRFAIDDSKLYAPISGGKVISYNLNTQSIEEIFNISEVVGNESIGAVQPNSDGTTLYCIADNVDFWFGNGHGLVGIDLSKDSMVLAYPLGPGFECDVRITGDGSQLVFNDPSDGYDNYYGTGDIITINPDKNSVNCISPNSGAWEGLPVIGMYPGNFIITPDSRYAIFAGIRGGSSIGMLNLATHAFDVVYAFPPNSSSPWLIECQKYVKL